MNAKSKSDHENENVYDRDKIGSGSQNITKIVENIIKNEQNHEKTENLPVFVYLFRNHSDKTGFLFFLKNSFVVFIFEKHS